jgi:hypothetical protein
MTRHRVLMAAVALLITAGSLQAQTPQKTEDVKGAPQVKSEQITGEVVWVQGDTLLTKGTRGDAYTIFNVKPGREFIIDGQPKHISDLKVGTLLTATVTTTTTPVTARTTSSLTGRVQWAQGNFVILTLPNGENKEYTVPESYKFMVDGKPASVAELRPGMNVSATKIVEVPRTEIAETTVVTGKSPK